MTMLSKSSSPLSFSASQVNVWIPLRSSRGSRHVLLEAIPLADIYRISSIGVITARLTYGDKYDREHGEEFRALSIENTELAAAVSTKFWVVDLLPFRM